MADSPAAERRLDETAVRALVQEVRSDLARLPLRLVAEGWDNSTWRLGDRCAVRLPRRALAAPLIANEQRALVEIGPLLEAVGVLSPIPIIAGRPTARFPWPWSVVPWISGTTAVGVDRRQAARWAPALAVALGALHVSAPPDAPHNPVRGVPLALRDEVMRSRLADARRAGLAQYEVLRDAWAAGLHARAGEERVWVHGDLHPGNIVVNGDALTALIDFGDVTVGDPAYDLAVSWMLLDSDGRAQFRSATGTRYDDATWLRARAWAAYIALVLLTQSDDRPDLLGVGLGTAEELARS
jgi:aminoglycoside phosphotransferase (APT) family kinase protein